MSSHLYFISVKRLRIEKGTSDDADKFEAVADTGKVWKHVIYFPSSDLECYSREYCLFQSLSTQRTAYRLMIFLWVIFQRFWSPATLKTEISRVFLSFLSRWMYQIQHICGSSYCLDMTILSLYTKLVYNHEMISICYVLL